MLYFIYIGVFLTVVLLVIFIYNLFFSERRNTLYRLERYASNDNDMYIEKTKAENINLKQSLYNIFGYLGKIFTIKKYLSKRKKKLTQAAILMRPEEFLGVSIISALVISLLVYLFTKSIIMLIIFLPIGFLIPELVLERKKSKRRAKLSSQLPEALNVIANGIRAGYSFTQALGTVTKEISGPISDEFNKVLRDNLLGKPLEESLTNMSERTGDEDIDMAITALIIQRQVGGNLAEVFDGISKTIRERVKIKRDVRTMTAQGRISAVIISILPYILAVVLSIISPGYLNVMFNTVVGKIMIVYGVTMELIGVFILVKLIDIKV